MTGHRHATPRRAAAPLVKQGCRSGQRGVGRRLADPYARKRAGISQAELAKRMGVSQQQVQRLEDPEKSNPTVATLRGVAGALGCRLRLRLDDA